MPFIVKISRCQYDHELTVHAEPINDQEIGLTWVCEECKATRQSAEEREASELRSDKAVGGGGNEPLHLVSSEEEERQHHVYELIDNRDGSVFYVGTTVMPRGREYDHGAPNSTSAALPRIQEIRAAGSTYNLQIVASFMERKRAEAYECLLIYAYPVDTCNTFM